MEHLSFRQRHYRLYMQPFVNICGRRGGPVLDNGRCAEGLNATSHVDWYHLQLGQGDLECKP